MARVAGSRCDHVTGGLSGRLASVVARRAGSGRDADVGEACARKRGRVVTGLAWLGDRYVVLRHDDRGDPAAHGVACGTSRRRPLEDPALVT